LKFIVSSPTAAKSLKPETPYILINLLSTEEFESADRILPDSPPEISGEQIDRVDAICDDIQSEAAAERFDSVLFTDKLAILIFEAIEDWVDVFASDLLIVCVGSGGMGQATGVAAAIASIYNKSGDDFLRNSTNYVINDFVYDKMLEVWGTLDSERNTREEQGAFGSTLPVINI